MLIRNHHVIFASCRTELHFNHFAENSAFGLYPHSKVRRNTPALIKWKNYMNLFFTLACCVSLVVQPEDKQKGAQQFTKLQAAMKVLGISTEEQRTVWLILGAIYHLGAAGATKGKTTC